VVFHWLIGLVKVSLGSNFCPEFELREIGSSVGLSIKIGQAKVGFLDVKALEPALKMV